MVMKKNYTITGMTCGSCVAKVQEALSELPGISDANIQREVPQAMLTMDKEVALNTLQTTIAAKGNYTITAIQEEQEEAMLPEKSMNTYKPLIMIIAFIAGVSVLVQYPFNQFDSMMWMRHFMAGFFIVFAFFKLLNLSGFADTYRMYDLLAAKWKTWGFIYPFVELSLGVLYLINIAPQYTNMATIVVLGFSSIGVIKSNLDKRKIKCACLGDVFNLPMSTVTIIEDVGMVLMAVVMLLF
jgi:copper chaperone CopZ